MPTITRTEAVSRMSAAIKASGSDDLVEVHNELFPEAPHSADETNLDVNELMTGIRSRIQSGLATEEIVDLWNVVFPGDRNVWYDDETDSVHFNEEPEYVESTE